MEYKNLHDATLTNPWIRGEVELDKAAQAVFVAAMQDALREAVVKAVADVLAGTSNADFKDLTVDELTVKSHAALPAHVGEGIMQSVLRKITTDGLKGTSIESVKISKATVDDTTLTNIGGGLIKDSNFSANIAALITAEVSKQADQMKAEVELPVSPQYKFVGAEVVTVDDSLTTKGLNVEGSLGLSSEAVAYLAQQLAPYFERKQEKGGK